MIKEKQKKMRKQTNIQNSKIRQTYVGAGPVSAQIGITLIALVITIIVLLILAGITLNLTLGENGIIRHAQNSGIEYEKAQLKEELELAILDIKTEKLERGQDITRDDLAKLASIGATMESLATPAEGEYKDYYFEIDENYNVTIIGKLQGEKPTIQAQILTEGIVEQGGTSSNQRIIDLNKTRAAGHTVLWQDDPIFADHRM